MNVYLDTSAYVKRYINEANSDSIDALFNDAYNNKIKIITSILTIGEISIVFDKLWRKQIIEEPIEMFNRFYDEVRNLIKLNAIDLININSHIMIRSSKICMDLHKPLADVIHIVSSMNISSIFITADKEQNSIASSLGVKTRFI
ncbi:PIN-domain RNase, VapC-type toxin [Ferroplasma acidiphilum]|uniref:PIN-domain RNase, VapC-type toxin n=1 Tax=Ferroplasma acidiphilum TaxID=74969 RepID=A0A1V0N3W8_9ARCH|nr:type II toxin-antitoxin system VapC family toxin [Ferroplasma acidiphilum]ARD84850.1 PIN-domain RNase, VapC-type toxin [Ferroplasma acidiphilum]